MFQNTRLKLTLWYMMILTFVCMCFSAVIFRLMSNEIDRFALMQQQRIERRATNRVFSSQDEPTVSVYIYDPELIQDIRNRLLLSLLLINSAILLISSGLAYLLAGKTLQPIQVMVAEQHRFISDASHELKTPITSLKTALEVFSRDKNATFSDAKVLISESIEDVNKLQALSENMLQLAQYQSSADHNKFERVKLPDIIKQAVRTVQPMAKQKNIRVETQVQQLLIYGNRLGLIDLFTILLDNAVKYSKENSQVTLLAQKVDEAAIIRVSDEGIGIDKKDLPHIFDRFYRTDSARTKHSTGGYGLGLAIAKKIVERHSGQIEVWSQKDKGTTFMMRFPLLAK